MVGSGPNGLAGALTLAQAGLEVLLIEQAPILGGGARTAELTLPGFWHDICSAVHPLGLASPFFKNLDLPAGALEWIHPLVPLAHPFDDSPPALLERSIEDTAAALGRDERAWAGLFGPLSRSAPHILEDFLGPLPLPPRHPLAALRFGLPALLPAGLLARLRFKGARARALFAGMAAHSLLPLERPPSAAFGLMLGMLGHAVGWPLAAGGSQSITRALAERLLALGGEIITGWEVRDLSELPPARIVLLDVSPRRLLSIAGARLPAAYRRSLARFRCGPGSFKVDWALSQPVPWKAPECRRAGTVHLGGTLEEISRSEAEVWQGRVPARPFVLFSQPSLFDQHRAPPGLHTAWAYCHVPNGSEIDMLQKIEDQVERFAPGFRDTILARHTFSAPELEAYNPNYVGGDINGGVQDLAQMFTRPTLRRVPYATPLKGVYLCSASTPPGGGVHGMCGFHAARAALRRL